MASFATAIAFVLANEGSTYVNHAQDHGGATRYGITRATLSLWRERTVTPEEVAELTMEEAREIYYRYYWTPIRGGWIGEQRVATALMDAAVLCGVARAVRMAQTAVGVKADGMLGPQTLAALNASRVNMFLPGFLTQLNLHLIAAAQGAGQGVFLTGWIHRSSKLAGLVL